MMDLHDSQWSTFRGSLRILLVCGSIHSLCSIFARKRSVQAHQWTQAILGLAFVIVLHGYHSIYVLFLGLLNFGLTKVLSRQSLVPAVWLFNLGALVVVSGTGDMWEIESLSWFSGLMGWAHHFNMVMLKMISFGVDYARASTANHMHEDKPERLDYKTRQETDRSVAEYSLLNYLGFIFYAPLYIAGPIMSFNAWQSQMIVKQTAYSNRGIGMYTLRWVGIFLLMEVQMHYHYSNAIAAQKSAALQSISDLYLAFSVSVAVLFFMWMKFLLIWRFFRLWSLCNGIECPENMNRFVLNNYSMAQFWKSWHSSYNVWLLRYVYIPLGGSRLSAPRKLFNVLVVFTFVALWHDLTWRVFHWAWIVTAVFAPEMLGTYIWRVKMVKLRARHPSVAKAIKILAGALNTLTLIAANLVGYVFGVDGLMVLFENVRKRSGQAVGVVMLGVFLFTSTSMMLVVEYAKKNQTKE